MWGRINMYLLALRNYISSKISVCYMSQRCYWNFIFSSNILVIATIAFLHVSNESYHNDTISGPIRKAILCYLNFHGTHCSFSISCLLNARYVIRTSHLRINSKRQRFRAFGTDMNSIGRTNRRH